MRNKSSLAYLLTNPLPTEPLTRLKAVRLVWDLYFKAFKIVRQRDVTEPSKTDRSSGGRRANMPVRSLRIAGFQFLKQESGIFWHNFFFTLVFLQYSASIFSADF